MVAKVWVRQEGFLKLIILLHKVNVDPDRIAALCKVFPLSTGLKLRSQLVVLTQCLKDRLDEEIGVKKTVALKCSEV
jgi:hypothetical protein